MLKQNLYETEDGDLPILWACGSDELSIAVAPITGKTRGSCDMDTWINNNGKIINNNEHNRNNISNTEALQVL